MAVESGEDSYSYSWSNNKTNEIVWIEVVSCVVCVLSILGSLAIILTYAFIKEIRSKARELLVHLSLMDLMYSTANLVGLWMPYREHLHNATHSSSYDTYHNVCVAQAFIAIYGTIGSVLWTLGLAVYLYYKIVARDDIVSKRVLIMLYILCYSLPLYVCLWLLRAEKLGYPSNPLAAGGGWCSYNDNVNGMEIFMTYDIWMWLGVMVLVPLYFTIHIDINEEVCDYYRQISW